MSHFTFHKNHLGLEVTYPYLKLTSDNSESCEMWLHGKCVNITKRTLPSVYICAFCANTPNMRGGRVRDNGRSFGAMGPPGSATSPLAHKSFKFR